MNAERAKTKLALYKENLVSVLVHEAVGGGGRGAHSRRMGGGAQLCLAYMLLPAPPSSCAGEVCGRQVVAQGRQVVAQGRPMVAECR